MKSTLITLACVLLTAASFASLPNEKVLKSFQETFSGTTDVKWHDHSNYYDVSFVQNDIRASVRYDKEGNFLGSTRYYHEQHLPTNILYKLKKNFSGKRIYGVTEITNNEEVTFYVKLEDSTQWLTIKVTGNGELQTVEKFNKG